MASAPPRVGFYGLLGQGNLGNDGSLEAVLTYMRSAHPEAVLDARCSGPEVVAAEYHLPSVPLRWYQPARYPAVGLGAKARRSAGLGLGLIIDTVRTASWVRTHDSVIVPGMGVLEQTVPLRPWQTPYLMFLITLSGKLFGTKVALVSVGTNVMNDRFTRWLFITATRLAHYRSFRDDLSRDAMRQMGRDVSSDKVFPDVVFSLQVDRYQHDPGTVVGVGIMDYSGGPDECHDGDRIRAEYVAKMTDFIEWLVERGRQVRVFTSDSADAPIVSQIVADVHDRCPHLGPAEIVAEPVTSLSELLRQTASVSTVVATRFHNVLYALRLNRPTIALGYAAKHGALMTEMGMADYCQQARTLDVDRLIEQFTDLEEEAPELRRRIAARNAANAQLVNGQFAELSAILFPDPEAHQPPQDRPGVPGTFEAERISQ